MASAVPLPSGEIQFVDGTGIPYAAGSVAHYIPGGFVSKTTWQDPLEQSPNLNPIILDAAGRATIFGDGQYRQILKDSLGNTIWDKATVALGTTAILAEIPNFIGDSGTGGVAGLVPAPPAGAAAQGLYLGPDGNFDSLSVVVPVAPSRTQAGFLFVPQRIMSATADALALSDSGGNITYQNVSAGSLTISANASVNWVTNCLTQILLINPVSSGQLSLVPDTGVTLSWPGNTAVSGTRIIAPNGQALLTRWGPNFWTVIGAGLS